MDQVIDRNAGSAQVLRAVDPARTYRFGVNYVPSRNWWCSWNDFDASAIARDLDSVASVGLDHIRIMLLWPYFQPNPAWVSPAHLARFERLMTLAAERGIDVCVTALNGFLSGFHFRPPFYSSESIYAFEPLIKAQEHYFAELASVAVRHENFLGFDLGNEINCYQSAAVPDGDSWMRRMLGYLDGLCPERFHVNGVDHQPWFRAATFSPLALAECQKIVPIHCWTYFTGALQRGGPLGAASVQLLARMASLVRAHAHDNDKPVWVQEYGASLEWMDESSQAAFIERATLAAIDEGVSWFTWWCSHDIDPAFKFASLEYGLGMFTTDNRPKGYTSVMKQLASAYAGKPAGRPARSLREPPSGETVEDTWRWLEAC